MAICRFYQQGYCKFGDSCRFEHPGANRQPQSTNRFGALSGGTSSAMAGQQENPYSLAKDTMQRDLADERPTWILSAYGPGKDAPEQLFGGYPREQSFEEIRLHYMQGLAAGNPQGALNEIEGLNQTALQQIQTALGNLDGAIQFIVDAGNKHPNRRDICQQGTMPGGTTGEFAVGKPRNPAFGGGQSTAFGAPASTALGAPSQPANPFGAPSQPGVGGFGQPAALGQKPNPFGAAPAATPAFGLPSQPASAFGQSSALGAKPSPFGAPAFGQPAQPAPTSAFGQPSQASKAPAFGQPSQPGSAPAFGQPSLPAGGSAFGQPSQPAGGSAFGQPSQPSNAFGQTSGLGQRPNPWGAPAGGAASSPFGGAGAQQPAGQPAFGQPSQPQQNASPFGQPAAAAQPAANPFGQPSTSSPFGQPQQARPSPFGQQQQQQQQQPAQANPFGAPSNAMDTSSAAPAAAANPFGAPPKPNPFGQAAAAAAAAAPNPNPFGAQPNGTGAPAGQKKKEPPTNPYPDTATAQHPPVTSYSSRDPQTDLLTMFKGRAVSYVQPSGPGNEGKKPVPMVRMQDGSLSKVWFPDGPPGFTDDTEAGGEGDKGMYDRPEVTESWRTFRSQGFFADGVMPEVPPRREWCTWDF
ncbi:Nucleoporin nup42 [Coniochaeta hoffmannii]|uniref:Nucleoporin nup42 n=1 Tax=Coniochaeta hoffmannii TaxID=91930 RepID=A0AA38RV73_9PEZI|nr:Nucleoporin nup42 [Coniochaeta hoffmannii]